MRLIFYTLTGFPFLEKKKKLQSMALERFEFNFFIYILAENMIISFSSVFR